ncbi:MAG: DUF3240 family protein [Burkholderiaceae bacterium]|jgi:hypothetical protein|nr:DUF3240 family protein [Burkholderiaceae bacterium]MEB2350932.1 DUF3240 family protein [Burkholderiaceae bacterium]
MTALSPLVCLVLLIPASAEDRVVDWLLERADQRIEFSVHRVAARGPLVKLKADDEQVQGFAERIEVKLVLQRELCLSLVSSLRTLLGDVDGGYWTLPVEAFGVFGNLSRHEIAGELP